MALSGTRWGATEHTVGGTFVLTIGLAIVVNTLRGEASAGLGSWVGGFLTALGLALLVPGVIAKGIELARRSNAATGSESD